MAQTVTAISSTALQIGVSVDASSWTDISGASNQITVSGGEQPSGNTLTATGEHSIVVGTNKHAPFILTVRCVYTETASTEPWEVVSARFQGAAKTIAVRYAPKGGIGSVAGNNVWTTGNGAGTAAVAVIKSCLPPTVDATSGDVVMFEFSVETPELIEALTVT